MVNSFSFKGAKMWFIRLICAWSWRSVNRLDILNGLFVVNLFLNIKMTIITAQVSAFIIHLFNVLIHIKVGQVVVFAGAYNRIYKVKY